MADRYTQEQDRRREWRSDDEDRRDRWQGGEESRFADAAHRRSAYGHDPAPHRAQDGQDYGASRATPRWNPDDERLTQAYEDRYHRDDQSQGWRAERPYAGAGYQGRWDQHRDQARRADAYRSRARYEASRFSSENYEPSRAGFDPYVSDYGSRSSGYRADRGPEYTYGRDPDRSWWDHTKDRVAGALGDDDARLRADHDSYRGYEPGRGRYYGHGPKGYSRSDDRVREDVSDRLSDDSWLDASSIEVSVAGAEVTLAGTVQSRSDKRRAEDLTEMVSGVKHVQNNLRVQTPQAVSNYGDTAVPSTTRATGSTTGKVS